jgi:diguanylate cyclase (GGDEF)-like protein/PAS domain S-box-containing protein
MDSATPPESKEDDHLHMPRPVLAPTLIIAGAALLILTSGAEIFSETRAWLLGKGALPRELILHALVAGAALLLAAAVLMTRRSVQRTAAAEAALRESEARLRLVANNVPALISYVDREQRYRFSNRTYDDWFGIAHEQMQGRTVAEVFGEEAYGRMRPDLERCLGGEGVEFEFVTTEGGRRRTLQVACVPHFAPSGERGEVLGFYMLANDVTVLKRAQEDLRFAAVQLQNESRRLEFLAHHDTLTGLPNRAMFADRAREAVAHARRHEKNAAFLFLDMDNFKQVNDGLGHEVGDELLKIMASRLRASVRGDDFVARIGGDEFCVLLQDIAEPREAAAVAQKLVHELGKPYRVAEHQVTSGASIGIACVPQDGDDVSTLLRLADHAMYRAKELGRNGYQFFSGLLNDDAAAAAELAEDLRAGIERGELFLVYQPRIDTGTRQVVGAEALLRWRHPRHGVLAPEAFLPLADDTGLLVPVGRWILREACIQGRRWVDAGIRPFSVVVNMTARQLRNAGLAEDVRAALQASGLPAESLLIELPETAARQISELTGQVLGEVTACGARLSVDDFGTGYASLPLLQRLRVSSVCIDRSLIAGVPHDTERAGLARALIALARGLEFEVVAKGVETQAQHEFLTEAGCRICQGELFAPARPAGEVEPFLRARLAA